MKLTTDEVDATIAKLAKEFMAPEFEYGDFAVGDTGDGSGQCVPIESAEDAEWDAAGYETERGWYYRLSASGYMDCTDWCGPFATEALARLDCAETYGDDY